MDASIADVLQRYAAAFTDDHERAAIDFYTDDVVLRIPGRHPYAGEFRGRGPVLAALDALTSTTDGTFGAREVKDAVFAASTEGASHRQKILPWSSLTQ